MDRRPPSALLRQSFRECRRYTRRHARTFYFASLVLPRPKRLASYAVYAFCRTADDIVDVFQADRDTSHALRDMQAIREQLALVYGPPECAPRQFIALRDVVERYAIPRDHFLDLLRGVEMDLAPARYATFTQLREYCYCVASVVGLMMSRILGVRDAGALRCAEDLGTAMQLTNILRDVGEDWRMGRVYLPLEEMASFGVGEGDLRRGLVTPGVERLLRFQVARARALYRSADAGIPAIPDDGSRFCVRLMSTTYERILDRIEANGYDVFSRRAFVPLPAKVAIALGAARRDRARGVGASGAGAGAVSAGAGR